MSGPSGRDIYNTFALAYELRLPLIWVAQMSDAERMGWLAFFEIRAEQRQR